MELDWFIARSVWLEISSNVSRCVVELDSCSHELLSIEIELRETNAYLNWYVWLLLPLLMLSDHLYNVLHPVEIISLWWEPPFPNSPGRLWLYEFVSKRRKLGREIRTSRWTRTTRRRGGNKERRDEEDRERGGGVVRLRRREKSERRAERREEEQVRD